MRRLFAFFKTRAEHKKVERQWPSALLLLSGALRAGLPLADALDVVVSEAPPPLKQRLALRSEACAAWLPLGERIERLFSEDYLALPRAILLFSHESGGKMASLIAICADLLEKKIALREKTAVLTAEGRMSAWVVGASPFVLLVFLSAVSPEFTRPLFVLPAGRLLLGAVVIMVGAGLFLVHRAVRIEP